MLRRAARLVHVLQQLYRMTMVLMQLRWWAATNRLQQLKHQRLQQSRRQLTCFTAQRRLTPAKLIVIINSSISRNVAMICLIISVINYTVIVSRRRRLVSATWMPDTRRQQVTRILKLITDITAAMVRQQATTNTCQGNTPPSSYDKKCNHDLRTRCVTKYSGYANHCVSMHSLCDCIAVGLAVSR